MESKSVGLYYSLRFGSCVDFSLSCFTVFKLLHSKFLRLHFEPFGLNPTTSSRAERGTSHIT